MAAAAQASELNLAKTDMMLFQYLPVSLRRQLHFTDIKSAKAALLMQDWIHEAYSQCAKVIVELQRKKRTGGFCGGLPSCLNYVGFVDGRGQPLKHILCSDCRALSQERRQGISFYKRRQTPYGKIRAKQRSLEKAERSRKQGGSK